jgi:DNA replication protein DnaC
MASTGSALPRNSREQLKNVLRKTEILICMAMSETKLPLTAAEELLEIIMRWYGRTSTMLTSYRTVEDWGKLLEDAAAVSAMLDRILHYGQVLKCGPRS